MERTFAEFIVIFVVVAFISNKLTMQSTWLTSVNANKVLKFIYKKTCGGAVIKYFAKAAPLPVMKMKYALIFIFWGSCSIALDL